MAVGRQGLVHALGRGQVQSLHQRDKLLLGTPGQARVVRLLSSDAGVAAPLVVMAWPDQGVGWQREQHLGDAAPQGARVAGLEVGTSTTADEQGVPGEHMVTPQVAHAARRMARGVQGAQLLTAKVQHITIRQLHLRRADAAGRRCRRARAGVLGQQGGTGDVVGMVVRFHRPAQPQAPRLQHGQVTLDLCIDRIDDQGLACVRVVQQVGAGAGGGVQELQRVHGGGSELFKIKTGYSARPYCASSYYFYSIYSHCGAGSSRSWRRKRA